MPDFRSSLPSTPAVAVTAISNQLITLFSSSTTQRSPYFTTPDRTPLFPIQQSEIAELKKMAQDYFTISDGTVAADDNNKNVSANLRIVRKITFDPNNSEHTKFIQRCTDDCSQKLDRLEEADALMITGFTTGLLMSCLNFIPLLSWVGFAGWIASAYHWRARQQFNEDYRESLHLLVGVMNWSLGQVSPGNTVNLSQQLLQQAKPSLLQSVTGVWTQSSGTTTPKSTADLRDILNSAEIQAMANFLLPLLEEDRLAHLIDDQVENRFLNQQKEMFHQDKASNSSYQHLASTDNDSHEANDAGGQLTDIKFLNTQLSQDAATIRRKWYGYGNGNWADSIVSCFGPLIDIAKRIAKQWSQANQQQQLRP